MNATRHLIRDRFGDRFLPEKPRYYKNKAKNAQEAHEAIRPTDPKRMPSEIAFALDEDEKKLYDLIWKRTIASQMAAARMERTTAVIDNADGTAGLRATGTVMMFDGFLKL